MGLLKAGAGAIGGVMADQWLEYFYCEAIPVDILVTKGKKRVSGRSSNTGASDNIISNGSVIAISNGQCMIIVEQGKVVDLCAEPGEYKYDQSTEPSIFYGSLGKNILGIFKNIGKRFAYGGEPPKDQRVYYFNIKEILGNKYGTPSPVPFRVVDPKSGLDLDAEIRCSGEYSYKVSNPILFYTNVCGNVESSYPRSEIDSQIKAEVISALRPVLAKISAKGIRYSELPEHENDLLVTMNEVMSDKWRDLRGIEMVSFTMPNAQVPEQYMDTIRKWQQRAVLTNTTMAAATLVSAQAEAMESAAKNEGAGPAMAFMGMNLASQAGGGVNAQNLFEMGKQQQQQQAQAAASGAAASSGWACECGQAGNTGKFCSECAKPKPVSNDWVCGCGNTNTGRFCSECAKPRP